MFDFNPPLYKGTTRATFHGSGKTHVSILVLIISVIGLTMSLLRDLITRAGISSQPVAFFVFNIL